MGMRKKQLAQLLAVIAVVSLAALTESTAALIHHYEFNPGNELTDSVGGNDLVQVDKGSAATTPTLTVSGGFARQVGTTNNNGSELQLTSTLGFGSGDDWTLAFRVRDPDGSDNTGFEGAVSNNPTTGSGGPNSWQFHWNNDTDGANRLFGAANGTGGFGDISDGRFHHVALVHDSAAPGPVLYFDGVLAGNSWAAARDHLVKLLLFRNRNDTTTEYFTGDLDDVRVYDNALTSQEVRALAIPEPNTALAPAMGLALLSRRRRTKPQSSDE